MKKFLVERSFPAAPPERTFALAYLFVESPELLRNKSVIVRAERSRMQRLADLGVGVPALVALLEESELFCDSHSTSFDRIETVIRSGREDGITEPHLVAVGGEPGRWLVVDQSNGSLGYVDSSDGFRTMERAGVGSAEDLFHILAQWIDDLVDGAVDSAVHEMRWQAQNEEDTSHARKQIRRWCERTRLEVEIGEQKATPVSARRVSHHKFGLGTVVAEDTGSPEPKLTIRFDDGNERILLATFVRPA